MTAKASLLDTLICAVNVTLGACEAEDVKKNEAAALAKKVLTDLMAHIQAVVEPLPLRPADTPLPATPLRADAATEPSVARAPARMAEGGLGNEVRLQDRDIKKESMNATSRAQAATIEACGKTQQKAERDRKITAARNDLELLVQQRDVEDAAAPVGSSTAAT